MPFEGKAAFAFLTVLLQLLIFFAPLAAKAEDGKDFIKGNGTVTADDPDIVSDDLISGDGGDDSKNENDKDNDSNDNDDNPLEIQIRWNGTDRDHYWYRGGAEQFEFVVMVEDHDEEGELTASIYCVTEEEEIGDVSDKKECVPVENGQVSFGGWVYDREGDMEHGDQRQSYVVTVEDQSGNMTKSEAVEVRIDETGPGLARYDGHPAVYYQFANAVHEKIKDRVQAYQIGDYLFQETLLSRTAVIVTVNVRDEAVKIVGEENDVQGTEEAESLAPLSESAVEGLDFEVDTSEKDTSIENFCGSGVEKVVLKVNGKSFEPTEKPDGENGEGIYRFQLPFLPGEEIRYCPEALELTDRAGNRTVYRFGA